MKLSYKELKDILISKGGYTINANHNQLNDLKMLLEDMNQVRNGTKPGTGTDDYSGTNCNGHINKFQYNEKLSLGDMYDVISNIKSEVCPSVKNSTCGCVSRSSTPVCQCNTRTACDCQSRTYSTTDCTSNVGSQCPSRTSCSCNSNVPMCTCNARTASSCDCQSRTRVRETKCTCMNRDGSCSCQVVSYPPEKPNCSKVTIGQIPHCICDVLSSTIEPACICDSRTSEPCSCQSRTSSCGTVQLSCQCNTRTACDCQSRTIQTTDCTDNVGAQCPSRTSISACTCNGRCACNSEKRFE